jgi:hypothetical protein
MWRYLLPVVGLGLLLPAAGCSGTKFQKADLKLARDHRYLEVEFKPPKSEQKFDVSASCDEIDVRLWVVLIDDKDDAINALLGDRSPRKVLASSDSGREVQAEATVPAGKGFVVLVSRARPAGKDDPDKVDVKLNVKSR